MDQKKIGAFIAQCRKEKSLTQIQLAELLDITNQAVLNGKMVEECPMCRFYNLYVMLWELV